MKLVIFEIKKHINGRLLWLVLAILLVINMALCYYYTSGQPYLDTLHEIKAVDRAYRKDPDKILGIYEEYKDVYEEYEKAFNVWFVNRTSPHRDEFTDPMPAEPDIPSTIVEGKNDYIVTADYFERIIDDEKYKEQLDGDMLAAVRSVYNYRSNNFDRNSYTYRYQLRYLEVYNKVKNRVTIEEGYDYGWGILFSYSGTGLFIFLAAIFMGSRLFTSERDAGMNLLVRVSKRGRARSAALKMIAMLIISLLLAVIFTLSSMLVIGIRVGFSSPFDSVQQIDEMFYCPYDMSMLTCLMASVAISALAAFTTALVAAGFSLIFRRSLGAMMICAALVGASYYAFLSGTVGDFLKYINLFTATSAETLFGKWRAIHIGQHPVNQTLPLTIMLVIIFAAASEAVVIPWHKYGIGTSPSRKGGNAD